MAGFCSSAARSDSLSGRSIHVAEPVRRGDATATSAGGNAEATDSTSKRIERLAQATRPPRAGRLSLCSRPSPGTAQSVSRRRCKPRKAAEPATVSAGSWQSPGSSQRAASLTAKIQEADRARSTGTKRFSSLPKSRGPLRYQQGVRIAGSCPARPRRAHQSGATRQMRGLKPKLRSKSSACSTSGGRRLRGGLSGPAGACPPARTRPYRLLPCRTADELHGASGSATSTTNWLVALAREIDHDGVVGLVTSEDDPALLIEVPACRTPGMSDPISFNRATSHARCWGGANASDVLAEEFQACFQRPRADRFHATWSTSFHSVPTTPP